MRTTLIVAATLWVLIACQGNQREAPTTRSPETQAAAAGAAAVKPDRLPPLLPGSAARARAAEQRAGGEARFDPTKVKRARIGHGQEGFDCGQLRVARQAGRALPVMEIETFKCARIACDEGNAFACYYAGLALRGGVDQSRDVIAARAVLGRACELKHQEACVELGSMLRDGEGGDADPTRARALFEGACEGGDARGCYLSGATLHDGGAAFAAKALEAFERGCELSSGPACLAAGILVSDFEGDGAAGDFVRGRALFERACDLDQGTGCFNLGVLLNAGQGGPADAGGARLGFARGCERKEPRACHALGLMVMAGQGGEPDEAAGAKVLGMACDLGHAPACRKLGRSAPVTSSPAPPRDPSPN